MLFGKYNTRIVQSVAQLENTDYSKHPEIELMPEITSFI